MANFKYRMMNSSGEKLEGVYAAASRQEVIEMIKSNNNYPLKVEEIIENKDMEIQVFNKVKTKDIAVFCRQFYTMLNAGATITTCLNVLGQQITNKRLKNSILSVDENVRKGLTLSEAFKKEEVFPELLISMVESGEVSGNLDTIMKRMSEHYEKENKLNNKVRGAMIYPIILAILSITIVVGILTFVMPTFVSMFQDNGVELPLPTRILLSTSNFLRTKWYLVIFIILAVVYALKHYFKTETGEITLNRLKLKLPLFKGMNEKIIVSRFTRTLSTVLASGISLIQGLQVVSKVLGNKVIENKIMEVRELVIKGGGLSQALKRVGFFPPMLCSMVSIGEESGSLDDILNKTADFYDDELETAIQQFTSMLEPIMILIMGVIIGFMIISIILPVFDMYNQIN
ncbi:type II secretion system protein F (GspF) [Clostridium cochlearium]|uniref:Type II secretion system protein F (GspF) n=1 Tax=Clostridium cochlearium TaxID=1494 RepID=A0ABY0QIS7_CLOCO|nr:type II secretion system F family protein [Clostridium cochlearium]SDK90272.1 type II secretion system protein F (GspF) [Clostridium cochlearium]